MNKSKRKFKDEMNENRNTTSQNLWDVTNTGEEFITLQAYLKKQTKESKNLTRNLEELQK